VAKFWALVRLNWKVSIAGICGFLLAVPGLVLALQAWAKHEPVDWRGVLVSGALTAISAGLTLAKSSDVHSTPAQIELSAIQNPQIQADSIVELKTKAPEVKP
jgi:hypothetical protein